ncbi:MAG TPA: cytochrome B [Candidatus Rokubacteria bacterium]|nr:cytochrome B [Candidatus Rokubacteria bacterium]HBH03542.1 cytochrome B [Candidatus Rokubacteria bacterium]
MSSGHAGEYTQSAAAGQVWMGPDATCDKIRDMAGDPATLPVARRHVVRRLYDWTVGWAERPGGTWALFLIAVAESSMFPVPPDVLLIALCVGLPRASFRFALVCSLGSVLGGVLGWTIGRAAWQLVRGFFIPWIFSQAAFDNVQQLYQGNAFLAILTAAFTPIPYKVFTVTAGVLDVSLATLVAASVLGRSARFFLVGAVIYLFGARVRALIDRYFDLFTWGLLALGVAGFLAVRYLR